MQVVLRALNGGDEDTLRGYLYLALFVPEGEAPLPAGIIEQPTVARYVANWGRAHDRGLVAVDRSTGRDVGAAWLRVWDPGDTGYGFVDYETPELSMAVRPEYRGQGIGTLLLESLLKDADARYSAVSLSVSQANPAVRLYERAGFYPVVSSEGSTTMRRERPSPGE